MGTELRSPALGWLLAGLVFSLCLGAEGQLTTIGGLPIRPYLPLLVVAAGAIAIRVARRGSFPAMPAKGTIWPLGVLLLAGILSIFNAEYSAKAVTQTVFLIGMIGIYLVLLLAELQPRDLRRITLAIVWSLAAAVAYGIFHFVSEYTSSGSVVAAFIQFHSFFEERNEFGLFMVYASGFLIPLALNDRAAFRYKILLVLTLVALLLNFSRGSLLAFVAIIVLDRLGAGRLFAPRPTRRSLLTLCGLGLATVAGALVLVPALVGLTEFLEVVVARSFGFGASADETTSIRLLFIRTAGRAFLNHPLIGNGIGNVGYTLNQFGRAADYGTVTFRGAVQPPIYDLGTTSNLFVDLLLETGLLGLIAFIAFLIALFRAARVRGRAQGWVGLMHTGAWLSLFGALINGLSYNSLYLPFTWVSFALVCATAAWQRSFQPLTPTPATPPASVT
jgi:O-antigen ligase